MAGFGCSSQASSDRNKPRPPVMWSCLVNRGPSFTGNALPAWGTHPIPVALSEICNLAHIEQATGTRELEGVGLTSGISSRGLCPTNPVPLPGFAKHLPSARHPKKVPLAFCEQRLRRPDFELLSPSVVIRRRPQRDQIFVSNA